MPVVVSGAPPERELFARFDTGYRPGEDAAERRSFGRS
jgi:hypothetical protein